MRSRKSIFYSAALHGIILFLLIVGLPSFMSPKTEPEPEVITVDFIPPGHISNAPPQENVKKRDTEDHDKTDVKAAPPIQTKVTPPPPPPPPPPKNPPKQPPKPPKQPPKLPKQPPKPPKDDLNKILEGVAQDAQKEGPKHEKTVAHTGTHQIKSTHYDPGAPLSRSDQDAIKQQVEVHWNAPVGAKDASNLKVLLHITTERDGSVTGVDFIGDKGRYASDSFFRAAVEAAIRAVHIASPLKNLPPEKYNVQDGWSDFNMSFDPHDM